jgi:type I restriction enzyme R subunit
MLDMLRNNPADVVFKTFSDAFFKGMIKVLNRDNELQNIILTDADARSKMTRLFFDRAYRAAQE